MLRNNVKNTKNNFHNTYTIILITLRTFPYSFKFLGVRWNIYMSRGTLLKKFLVALKGFHFYRRS